MGIFVRDLRELVIRPTLYQLDDWSLDAENLLLGTAAQESSLGFRMQVDEDPHKLSMSHREFSAPHHENRLGIFSLSATTHVQIWDEFLIHHPELASRLRGLASQHQFLKAPHHELITNLSYATGVAWMVYKRHKFSLPENPSPLELARHWFTCFANRDAMPLDIVTGVDMEPEKLLHNNLIDDFVVNFHKLILCDHNEGHTLAA